MLFQKAAIVALAGACYANANKHKSLRPRGRHLSRFGQDCRVVKANFDYNDGTPDEIKCFCEVNLPGPENMGRGREVLAELFDFDDCEGAESAVTEISSSNGFDYDGESNTVHIPPGSTISKKNRGGGVESNGRRRLATVGQKTVLVVRAEFFDASTGSTIATLGDEVFGTNGDVINLKSQYDACSYGQLTFSPVADGTTFSNGVDSSANSLNGVITVSNPSFNVIGQGDGVVREEMRRLVGGRKGNDINNQYHMLCIPPGTTGGWIGYVCNVTMLTQNI